jgi:hypothetical protein
MGSASNNTLKIYLNDNKLTGAAWPLKTLNRNADRAWSAKSLPTRLHITFAPLHHGEGCMTAESGSRPAPILMILVTSKHWIWVAFVWLVPKS